MNGENAGMEGIPAGQIGETRLGGMCSANPLVDGMKENNALKCTSCLENSDV